MSKKSVAVRISGNEYKIRSDSDEESLRQLALYVDNAMQRVREGTGTIDSLDVAVLTCLNLAREILALKDLKTSGTNDASLRALIDRVEAACPGGDHEALAMTSEETSHETSEETVVLSSDAEDASEKTPAPAKTLELPSIESLRDREGTDSSNASRSSQSGSERTSEAEDELHPTTRMAAGGGDRAS